MIYIFFTLIAFIFCALIKLFPVIDSLSGQVAFLRSWFQLRQLVLIVIEKKFYHIVHSFQHIIHSKSSLKFQLHIIYFFCDCFYFVSFLKDFILQYLAELKKSFLKRDDNMGVGQTMVKNLLRNLPESAGKSEQENLVYFNSGACPTLDSV